MNGADSCSGRVELKYLNTWGSVCALNWNMRAANVLCGQLNCGSAVTVVDWFEAGRGQMWADIFDCQGNETHLSQCPILSWSRAACSHEQDAGVICNGKLMLSILYNLGTLIQLIIIRHSSNSCKYKSRATFMTSTSDLAWFSAVVGHLPLRLAYYAC